MSEAVIALSIGIGGSIASAFILWTSAKYCRTAKAPSIWANEWVPTSVSLALVCALVMAAAWTVKGTVMLASEPIMGVGIGFAVVTAIVFVTLRLLGKLPENGAVLRDRAPVEQWPRDVETDVKKPAPVPVR